jgi:pyrroloquinoline quinone biosynthesis protein D
LTSSERLPDCGIPRLPRGVRMRYDEVRHTQMLLAPERAVRLDAVAAAILAEIDGKRTFRDIVDVLADKYAAPRQEIAADARTFLIDLMDKRMVELTT